MVDLHADAIELVDSRYDDWRDRFERERARIEDALASEAPPDSLTGGTAPDAVDATSLMDRVHAIEHVGSTAVPALPAKDIVDLDVVVDDAAVPAVSDAITDAFEATRYENSATWHVLAREHDGQRFNVHVFGERDDGWKQSVATRDVLRARPDLRDAYAERKRELAAAHDDLEAYSTGKTDLLDRVLRTARDADDLAFDFAVPVDDGDAP